MTTGFGFGRRRQDGPTVPRALANRMAEEALYMRTENRFIMWMILKGRGNLLLPDDPRIEPPISRVRRAQALHRRLAGYRK